MNFEVSVIIPVYNGENSIDISLNSLLRQTKDDFEVIIIDDGSKDNTKGIVLEYVRSDNRFKYFFQENSGVSAARNKGLQFAQGNYICFLDSDDYYENTFIEKMSKKIKIESADVCYCGYNIVMPNKIRSKNTKFSSENLLLNYISGRVSIHTTGWIISNKAIRANKIQFPEGVSWGEDFEFFCEVLSKTNRHVFVKEYLTNYRIEFEDNRLSSFSMDKIDKDYDSIQRVLKKIYLIDNKKIEMALMNYRLQALLIYRFLIASELDVPHKEVLDYYKKYEMYLSKTSWNNGIRSIKLNLGKFRLSIKGIK